MVNKWIALNLHPAQPITILHIMTEKQIERVKTKIKRIKAALAADKKRWGFYDDSRGLRYAVSKVVVPVISES